MSTLLPDWWCADLAGALLESILGLGKGIVNVLGNTGGNAGEGVAELGLEVDS